MTTSTRREFLGTGLTGFAAVGALFREAARAAPLGLPIGCQVYPVREQLAKDLDGTLRQIASIGYEVIEFCSPPGYANSGFAPLVGLKAVELRRRIEDAGLRVVSCHYQRRELRESIEERIAFARELGLEHMVIASLAIPGTAPLGDWQRAGDEANRFGEQVRAAGMQLAFHNHGSEFREIDGVLIFDELMRRFDKELVKSQFQVSILNMGFDPVEVVAKYPGRIASLHLQDWSAADKRMVPIGRGVIDWPKLFRAARTGGIKHYFVEMNMEAMVASYPFLKELKV